MKIEIDLKEALEIVLELAADNVLTDEQVLEDPRLRAEQERQDAAIEAVRIHMEAQ